MSSAVGLDSHLENRDKRWKKSACCDKHALFCIIHTQHTHTLAHTLTHTLKNSSNILEKILKHTQRFPCVTLGEYYQIYYMIRMLYYYILTIRPSRLDCPMYMIVPNRLRCLDCPLWAICHLRTIFYL